jgi:hypothetical protein
MNGREISQAKDKDRAGSLAAMLRAARAARELAVRTETAIVVLRVDRPVRITAEALRKAGVA